MTEMDNNKEKYCYNCQYDEKRITEYPCSECCNAYTSKYKGKTNLEKIKDMNECEMADFIINIYASNKSNGIRVNDVYVDPDDILEWLGSEAIT